MYQLVLHRVLGKSARSEANPPQDTDRLFTSTAFGFKMPSFMVKMAKARDYMIGNAPKLIEGNA